VAKLDLTVVHSFGEIVFGSVALTLVEKTHEFGNTDFGRIAIGSAAAKLVEQYPLLDMFQDCNQSEAVG